MTVNIRDIAKQLGLSIGAVSRALDGYPDISDETRGRVIKAAQETGYVPNQAARQLRRKKADAIGYILPANTPRFADPFFLNLSPDWVTRQLTIHLIWSSLSHHLAKKRKKISTRTGCRLVKWMDLS